MKGFATPRLWLFVWGGLGALFIAYMLIAASLNPGTGREGVGREGVGRDNACKASAAKRSPIFLTGEMADFTYAFPARKAPDAPFQYQGADMQLRDFRGKTVLVNFWATWCAPCLKELPSLNALQGALGSDDFEVVAVAADPKGPEAAREYLDRLNINNLKLYTDARLRLASAMGGGAVLPLSVLYDRKGAEIGRLTGEADWQSPEARQLIENTIGCS